MSATQPLVASTSTDPALALLVDRDRDTRQMYGEYFRLVSAFDIDEAEDGREALAKAIARHPDVVVTETRLPGMSGFDLCTQLRRDRLTTTIKVIFVTGDALEADVKRAERVGADAILAKPCLPEVLLSEIRRLFARSEDLRRRCDDVRVRLQSQLEQSQRLIEQAHAVISEKRAILSHSHARGETVTPPNSPPPLVCPQCDQPLKYLRSYVGGVSARHSEQWDYFECSKGCGTFQYRERTRKLRVVQGALPMSER